MVTLKQIDQLSDKLIFTCLLKHKPLYYHHIKFFHLSIQESTNLKKLVKIIILFKHHTRELRENITSPYS